MVRFDDASKRRIYPSQESAIASLFGSYYTRHFELVESLRIPPPRPRNRIWYSRLVPHPHTQVSRLSHLLLAQLYIPNRWSQHPHCLDGIQAAFACMEGGLCSTSYLGSNAYSTYAEFSIPLHRVWLGTFYLVGLMLPLLPRNGLEAFHYPISDQTIYMAESGANALAVFSSGLTTAWLIYRDIYATKPTLVKVE